MNTLKILQLSFLSLTAKMFETREKWFKVKRNVSSHIGKIIDQDWVDKEHKHSLSIFKGSHLHFYVYFMHLNAILLHVLLAGTEFNRQLNSEFIVIFLVAIYS